VSLRLWQWRSRPVDRDRRGEVCRVLVRSARMNSVLVEFEDGCRFVTSRTGLGRQVHPCIRCGDLHAASTDVCAP